MLAYLLSNVAPSLLPKQARYGVTPVGVDAVQLTWLMRSGDLTLVDVPAVEDEAIRDLSRAREEALQGLKAEKLRFKAFLLWHDLRNTGRANWRPAPLRRLSAVVCHTPAPHIVVPESVRAGTEPTERLQYLERERQEHVKSWRLPPLALHAA